MDILIFIFMDSKRKTKDTGQNIFRHLLNISNLLFTSIRHEIAICQRLSQLCIISCFQGYIEYTEVVSFAIVVTIFSLSLFAHQCISYRLIVLKPVIIFFISFTFTSNKLIKLA
jgi:hypothetical protein